MFRPLWGFRRAGIVSALGLAAGFRRRNQVALSFLRTLLRFKGAGRSMKRTLLLVAALVAVSMPVHAAPDELARLNARIMNDPNNAELNLQYARTAEADGDYGKALAAYERVLGQDPGNAEARSGAARAAARLLPNTFQVFTEIGGGYESNPQNLAVGKEGQAELFARVLLKDERTLWDTRWRTTALFSGNLYSQDGDLNYGYAGIAFGPVYAVTPTMTFHPSIGVGTSCFAHHSYYNEAFASALFEGGEGLMNYTVRYRIGYRDYNDFFPSTHGGFADIIAKLLFPAVLTKDDLFVISPWWRWSGIGTTGDLSFLVSPDDFRTGRYNEVGARVEYFKPVTDWITAGINFSALERYYARATDNTVFPAMTIDRRDYVYSPGLALIFRNPYVTNQSSVRLDYRYERDDSNTPLGSYTNHIGTITFFNRY